MPHPGNWGVAELTAITLQVIGGDEISPAFDQQLFAIVTIGVVAFMAGDISDIYISNPLRHRQFTETCQC